MGPKTPAEFMLEEFDSRRNHNELARSSTFAPLHRNRAGIQ
jgi:hypothetical protein